MNNNIELIKYIPDKYFLINNLQKNTIFIPPFFNHIYYKQKYNINYFNTPEKLYYYYKSIGKEKNHKPNNIPSLKNSFEYLKKYCLDYLTQKYTLSYNFNNNSIPLLFFSENSNIDNFLITNNITFNSNIYCITFILELIVKELFDNNIDWKYLIYTDKIIDIEKPIFINKYLTIYQIKSNKNLKKNYHFILENTNSKSNIYITTHQQLFINNIYKSECQLINKNYKYICDYNSYILSINDLRYQKFSDNILKKNINLSFTRFIGLNKNSLPNIFNNGHIACLIGHYAILKEKYVDNRNLLIIEDDCEFCDNFNNRWNNIKEYLDNNLDNWDIFNGSCLFSIYPTQLIKYKNENIIKYINNVSTNFVYYNHKIIKKIVHYIENFLFDLIVYEQNSNYIYDRFIRLFRCYTSIPFLTKELENNFSDISNNYNTDENNNSFKKTEEIVQLILDKLIN